MEGGSTGGYFAIRMKSDVVYEREYEGVRTQEKYGVRPGRYCGLVFLTDVETGAPLAIINDGHLQHLRVAADSAIGTDIMAREDCRTLGMLGSGGMAASHVEALLEVRRIERIRVFSPTPVNRERFAAEIAKRHGVECEACDKARAVYREADILAACTDSAVPVIRGAWLEPGMHVVSIGGGAGAAGRSPFRRPPRPTRRRGARGSGAICPPTGSCRTYAIEENPMRKTMKSTATLAAGACALFACGAVAQTTLFEYSGPDRMEKIVAAAKKEGAL